MSDEYTIATNFQRASDDPRAVAEYEHRMRRVREREAELQALADAFRETEQTK